MYLNLSKLDSYDSSRAHYTMAGIRDNYEDILDPRRKGSDFRFGVQTLKGVPEYKCVKRQTQKEVKEQILQSQRLQHVIGEVSTRENVEILVLVATFPFQNLTSRNNYTDLQ